MAAMRFMAAFLLSCLFALAASHGHSFAETWPISIESQPQSGKAPLSIRFTGKGYCPDDGTQNAWVIDFSDRTPPQHPDIQGGLGPCTLAIDHTYTNTGTYAVQLLDPANKTIPLIAATTVTITPP
jgi:PKD repeat protein